MPFVSISPDLHWLNGKFRIGGYGEIAFFEWSKITNFTQQKDNKVGGWGSEITNFETTQFMDGPYGIST